MCVFISKSIAASNGMRETFVSKAKLIFNSVGSHNGSATATASAGVYDTHTHKHIHRAVEEEQEGKN